jgi:UDP-galactopyranose mutase
MVAKTGVNYDLIIAGSGFAGGTIANLAARSGKRVLLLEKRGHIAGNMYDEKNEIGIMIQKYGIHSFHTDRRDVYDFISSIGEWEPFTLRARVLIGDKLTPSPFNFQTIDDYYDGGKADAIKERLLSYYGRVEKVTIVELLNCPDPLIKEYADFLFEQDYRPYTAKQWGIDPKDLDISVLKRVPVRLSYTDRYFDDTWQLLPKGGFTAFFEKMLLSDKIDIRLNTDILNLIELKDNGEIFFDGEKITVPVVYTGAPDELFRLKHGSLPYRSLRFEYKTLDTDSYQPTPGVAYPFAEGYTRIIEFSKIPLQKTNGRTTIAVEYPIPYEPGIRKEPYYPILTQDSSRIYQMYLNEAEKYPQLYLCGRLADFKYYNMDDVIKRALKVFNEIRFDAR